MKISKKYLYLTASCIGLVGLTGSVFASGWAVTDNADPVSLKVTVGALPEYTVTYYRPTGVGSAYASDTIQVTEGTNLYTALSGLTSNIGTYEFESWNESNQHFRLDDASNDKYALNTEVNSAMTVYAKYVEKNVGYYSINDNDTYLSSSQNDYAIDGASYFYYGDHIYGYRGVEGTGVDLIGGLSNYNGSGVYKLTKNTSDWTIKRKISIGLAGSGANDTPSKWWPEGSKTFVRLLTVDDSEGTWTDSLTYTNYVASFYADVKYVKLIAVRLPDSATSGTFDGAWNQTVDIYLDSTNYGSYKYSSTRTTTWIQNAKTDNKSQAQWG